MVLLSHGLAEDFRGIRWLCGIHNVRNEVSKHSVASILTIIGATVPDVRSSTVATCGVTIASAIMVARSCFYSMQSRRRQNLASESSGDHFCR